MTGEKRGVSPVVRGGLARTQSQGSCSEAELGVSHLRGSAWLGSPRVTSSSLGQSRPPAHHRQAGLSFSQGNSRDGAVPSPWHPPRPTLRV